MPHTRGVLSYGVEREYPPHLAGVYPRREMAEKEAEKQGPEYKVKLRIYRQKGNRLVW